MNKILECVPNFSEGQHPEIINTIGDEIRKVNNVKLLNVESGKAVNRTVMTIMGEPTALLDAVFNAIKKASELIDMRKHKGVHPRIGATDVCPLIPIKGITMKETVEYAHQLARRIENELTLPIYCYQHAALINERKNLAFCRKGEYEGLEKRMKNFKPDFGANTFNDKTGSTLIGARDILIAYNIDLDTKDVNIARKIAEEIRESGTKQRIEKNTLHKKGKLKKVKAIGWYIEEYGVAQISMNLVDYKITSLHTVFQEVCKAVSKYSVNVSGSELIGLIPLECLTKAGAYYLKKQNKSDDIPENELIDVALNYLKLKNFHPQEKIIEYVLEAFAIRQ